MGIFGNAFKYARIVKYTCSPKLDCLGLICLGTSLFAILAVVDLVHGFKDPVFIWFMAIFYVPAICAGAYMWKFRRKPFHREITLGTWYNRLYLRSKGLFLLVTLGIDFVSYVVGVFVVATVFNGLDEATAELVGHLKKWVFLLALLVVDTCRSFAGFYQYYRSPEYRRSLTKNNDNERHV